MKMAIQPISRTDYVSHVSFEGKPGKGQRPDGGQHMTTAAKAIPVVVLMAMSPLTQCASAENYNKQMASYPTTEVVVQNPQEPQKSKLPEYHCHALKGQHFIVWGVSRDDNPDNAETMLFNYAKDIGDNKLAFLAGQFIGISETQSRDGKYLMLYCPIDESGHVSEKYEIAYVPELYAIIMSDIARDSKANNRACVVAPIQDYIENFGTDAVKNAPNIEDVTNKILNKKN